MLLLVPLLPLPCLKVHVPLSRRKKSDSPVQRITLMMDGKRPAVMRPSAWLDNVKKGNRVRAPDVPAGQVTLKARIR